VGGADADDAANLVTGDTEFSPEFQGPLQPDRQREARLLRGRALPTDHALYAFTRIPS